MTFDDEQLQEIVRRIVEVASENDVREYGNSPMLIYREAMRDGKELYAA